MHVVNSTPWRTAFRLGLDSEGFETLTLVVKATFALRPSASDQQEDVVLADEFHGDLDRSSIRHPHELASHKPATDLLVSGFVYPLRKDPCRGGARLRCRNIDKLVEVVGDRHWQPSLVGYKSTQPAPFERMPLIYERAFGGRDDSAGTLDFDEHNPAGVGFRSARSKLAVANAPLPNVQHPTQPLRDPQQRVPAVGFGPIAAHWHPRRRYVGTYDAAWQRDRAPLLPRDFDARHHQQAPADQTIAGYVQPGDRILLEGMSTEGPMTFQVPQRRPQLAFRFRAQTEEHIPACDTILLDADAGRVSLLYRASARVHGRLQRLAFMGVRIHG